MPTTSDLWAFFDKIYCISVNERADRRASARAAFRQVGLEDRVTFILVPKHPVDAEQGIYESHLACMQKGLADGADRILIFEDDIEFDRFRPETLKRSIAFLTADRNWQIFFLGCLVSGSHPTKYPSVLKVTYRCLTHAYVIHRRMAEKLSRIPWKQVPFDLFLRKALTAAYAPHPAFAFQSNAPSDNDRLVRLDRFRRWCGGLKRIQKANAFYHRHWLAIIVVHCMIILALVGLAANLFAQSQP